MPCSGILIRCMLVGVLLAAGATAAAARSAPADGARRRLVAAPRRSRGTGGSIPQSIIDAYKPAEPPVFGSAALPPPSPPLGPTFGPAAYSQALGRSLLFFAAQRSGNITHSNRVPWRLSAHTSDRVPGGYYDAGDYLKVSYTNAHATLMLAWGGVEFRNGSDRASQTAYLRSAVRWGADYLCACHLSPRQFVGLIGDMNIDHDYWGRPEQQKVKRPAWVWNRTTAASDLLGLTSAALAATSVLFRDTPAYSAAALAKAKDLYAWAAAVPGQYSDSMPGYPQELYGSNRYADKLMLAAAWLHRATGNTSYLAAAHRHYQATPAADVSPYTTYDSHFTTAATLLLGAAARIGAAKVPGAAEYAAFIDGLFLRSHVTGDGTWGIQRTRLGLTYPSWSQWANNAYAANTAFVALLRAKQLPLGSANRVAAFALAKNQADYVLGGGNRSYVVGWGSTPPLRAHHAGASCPNRPAPCDWAQFDAPTPNPQVLHGALVGGPSGPGDAGYHDQRDDYVTNEVALDYNAGFTGALTGLLSIKPS